MTMQAVSRRAPRLKTRLCSLKPWGKERREGAAPRLLDQVQQNTVTSVSGTALVRPPGFPSHNRSRRGHPAPSVSAETGSGCNLHLPPLLMHPLPRGRGGVRINTCSEITKGTRHGWSRTRNERALRTPPRARPTETRHRRVPPATSPATRLPQHRIPAPRLPTTPTPRLPTGSYGSGYDAGVRLHGRAGHRSLFLAHVQAQRVLVVLLSRDQRVRLIHLLARVITRTQQSVAQGEGARRTKGVVKGKVAVYSAAIGAGTPV